MDRDSGTLEVLPLNRTRGNFIFYDGYVETRGRPRVNDNSAKLRTDHKLVIGTNIVTEVFGDEDGIIPRPLLVRIGINEERNQILIYPNAIDPYSCVIRWDGRAQRYTLYMGGFVNRVGIPREFYGTEKPLVVQKVKMPDGLYGLLLSPPEDATDLPETTPPVKMPDHTAYRRRKREEERRIEAEADGMRAESAISKLVRREMLKRKGLI